MVESSQQDETLPLQFAKQHYGTSLMQRFPKHLKPVLKQAIKKAEEEKGGPVLNFDIKIALFELLKDLPQDEEHAGLIFSFREALTDMWRTDEILFDESQSHWSMTPQDKFWTYSDYFEKFFAADYTLDDQTRLVPKEHRSVNFNWLKDLYLSKDLTRLDELRQLGEKCKMLDATVDLTGNRISFASFPRTGNTLLRTLIEQCTGIYTGGDMDLRIVVKQQFFSDMPGESHHNSDRVWVTKTHYPHHGGREVDNADKIIYITRNPIEVTPSIAYLQLGGSHSVVSEKPINEYTEFWEYQTHWLADEMSTFHNELMKQSEVTPTFFVRFEDLRENPKPHMAQLIAFMLDVNSIEGTVIEARLNEVCKEDVTEKARYKLKTTTKNLSRNLHLYNEEQLAYFTEKFKEHNMFFGYCEVEGVENTTPFFSYPNVDKEEMATMFKMYQKLNDQQFKEGDEPMGTIPRDKREVWKVNEKEGSCFMPKHLKKSMGLLPIDFRTKMP